MTLKAAPKPADRVLMVVVQPLIIALTMSLVIWAFRVLDDLERAES